MGKIAAAVFLAASAWLAGTAWAQSLPAGPKVTISTVTQPLPTQPQFTRIDVPYFTKIIPERSGGRIEGKTSTHAEMSLSGTEIIRLVRSGQVDIGASTLTTVSGDVPLLDGVDLTGLSTDIQSARKIGKALLPAANKELEKFGVQLLFMYPFPGQEVFCRRELSQLNDLKGRKVRTFGPSLTDFFTALGAQPVSIGFPEVYSALERGVVDCAITGTGSGNAAKWPEVTTHIYNLPLAWAVAGYFVNVSWWNKQDPAVRTFLQAQFAEMEEKLWALGDEATRDGIDCNIGKADGCKIHSLVTSHPMTEVNPTPADKELVKKLVAETVLPGWVKRCGEKCGQIYNEVVAPISGVRYAAK